MSLPFLCVSHVLGICSVAGLSENLCSQTLNTSPLQGLGGIRMTVDEGSGRQGGAEGGPGSVLVHPDDAVKRLKVGTVLLSV